jgi:transcriptional regulator with GAF, ATPase, and Fis domain
VQVQHLGLVAAEGSLDVGRGAPGRSGQASDVLEQDDVVRRGEQAAALLVRGEGLEHGAVGEVLLELADRLAQPSTKLAALLSSENLNLRVAEVALIRHVARHAETLAAAAAMLGLSTSQLLTRARRLRIALPFALQEGRL